MKRTLLFLTGGIFVVIVILPLGLLFFDALTGGTENLRHFGSSFFNPRTLHLIVNSFTISLGATFLGLALGVPLGFFISRTDIYFKKFAGYLYLFPLFLPSHINAIAWIELLGTQSGLSRFLTQHSLWGGSFSIYGITGAIWVLGLSYFPFVSLLTIAGLSTVDGKLEEQAQLVAGKWMCLWKITFPLVMPFIAAGALFVFIFSLSNYVVPDILRVNSYPIEIFTQFSAYYNQRQAILGSIPLLLFTIGLIFLCYGLMKDKSYVSLEGNSRHPAIVRLGLYKALCSCFAWGVIIITGILPLIALIISSGSIGIYAVAIKTSMKPIVISLVLSLCGASACTLLGFFLGYFAERLRSSWKNILDVGATLPLAVPGAIWGIGLIKLWNNPYTQWIYSTQVIVIFGFIASFLPFAVKTMASNFKQLNVNMEEAGILSRAGFLKILRKILIPLSGRAILISWIICFIFCMGESTASLLVIPAGIETLSIKIYAIMDYGVGQLTAALCVILILATMIPVVFLGWAFRAREYDYA